MRKIKKEDWLKEAVKRFGKDSYRWKFTCPSCGIVSSVEDWKNVGASEGEIAFSCIGRHIKPENEIFNKSGGPCNYAGGGLLRLNPVHVLIENGKTRETFEFADE